MDWGIIAKYMDIMDTDEIDIGRRMVIVNPDGSEDEILPDTPIYTGVKCHISSKTIDNPDTNTIDTKPTILSLKVECNTMVDIQNNDYITARKLDVNGNVLEEYKGNAGTPFTEPSRTMFYMDVKQNV